MDSPYAHLMGNKLQWNLQWIVLARITQKRNEGPLDDLR